MPNRIIKETIHTSDSVAEMSDIEFRVWMALITYVDDYGRGDARAAIIKGACFPLIERITPKVIDRALDGLVRLGCVRRYIVDGKPYLYLPTWEEHQRVRNKVSKFPAPPENAAENDNPPQVAASCGESPQDAARAGAESESESNPNPNPEEISARTRTRETTARKKFVPPSLEEVTEYCRSRNSPVDPKKFWEFFDEGHWKDTKGQPVRNWKQKLLTWESYNDNTKAQEQEKATSPGSFKTEDFFEAALKRSYDSSGTEFVRHIKNVQKGGNR